MHDTWQTIPVSDLRSIISTLEHVEEMLIRDRETEYTTYEVTVTSSRDRLTPEQKRRVSEWATQKQLSVRISHENYGIDWYVHVSGKPTLVVHFKSIDMAIDQSTIPVDIIRHDGQPTPPAELSAHELLRLAFWCSMITIILSVLICALLSSPLPLLIAGPAVVFGVVIVMFKPSVAEL